MNLFLSKYLFFSFLLSIRAYVSAQEYQWNNFSPDEWSEPVVMLRRAGAKSFELVQEVTNEISGFVFTSDSVIFSEAKGQKYVLRKDKFYPVLSKTDSLTYRNFWSNRKIVTSDSSGVKITEYFERKNALQQFRLIDREYDSPIRRCIILLGFWFSNLQVWNIVTKIRIVTDKKWEDELGISYIREIYSRTNHREEEREITEIRKVTTKSDPDQKPETEFYEIIRKLADDRIVEVQFKTNYGNGFTLRNIRY